MKLPVFLCFFLIYINICVAQVIKTESISDEIHTIQVNASGNWQRLPVIDLNKDEYIRINFDRLGNDSFNYLRYKVIHCNADWTRSSLSDIEYVDGFNDVLIEDYAQSSNTTINYTNFKIDLPNYKLKIRLSGNYAVEVYEDNNSSNVLMRACFSVLDSQVYLEGTVSSLTDIDAHKEHQQVSFYINYNNLQIRDPFSDFKVFVRQNGRTDNQKTDLKPSLIQGSKLVFEHNRNLIFEAGNEYRRFESVSYRYNGLNIERTEYKRPYNYTTIVPDKIKANKRYSYDQDQNGRFVIRNAEAGDSDTEADYFYTDFTLKTPEPFIEPVYLNGNFTNNVFDDKYLMVYDFNEKAYYASVLLKQGAYNYRYLTKSGNTYSTSLTEGNYYETENEYTIMVYYRPMGSRNDLLTGLLLIRSK